MAIAFVQAAGSGHGGAGGFGAITTTMPNAVTRGNLLVCWFFGNSNLGDSAVTDSSGNTWNSVGIQTPVTGSGRRCNWYWTFAGTSVASNTLVVTVTPNADAGNTEMMQVAEFSGAGSLVATRTAFSQQSSSTTWSQASGTGATTDLLLYGAAFNNDTGTHTLTPTAGVTNLALGSSSSSGGGTNGSAIGMGFGYSLSAGSTSAVTCTMTTGNSDDGGKYVIGFRAASAVTKTQTAVARIANNRTKTQAAKARIVQSSQVKLMRSVSGSQTGSNTASETITLPSYSAGETLIMLVARNQDVTAYTGDANVTVTQVALGDGRMSALKLTPVGTPTSFTLTATGTNGIWRWWIGAFANVDSSATIHSRNNSIGSNTTSAEEILSTTLGYISTGNEYALSAASVNSTATWTTDENNIFNNTTGNASMCINGKVVPPDVTAVGFSSIDRGNGGSARTESSLSLVLPAANATTNYIANASFETGSTLATTWQDEHTTATLPTYSLVTSDLVDGDKAQRIQYTGVGGDTNRVAQIFQVPIASVPGDVWRFDLYIKGTLTNVSAIIGMEAFTVGNAYISENDVNVTGLTGTQQKFSVTYVTPPLTDHIAAYFQMQGIGSTGVIDVTVDSARLYKVGTTTTKTQTAIARIANTVTKTQSAVARIANVRTKTQTATANIQVAGVSTKTQGAVARIANTVTKTQSAVARIANNLTRTQSATARIARSQTKTQTATAAIGGAGSKTQTAKATVVQTQTKTQSAIARISIPGSKTQTARARISNRRELFQHGTARIVQTVYLLTPPTTDGPARGTDRFWRHFRAQKVGVSILKEGGVYRSVITPTQKEINAAQIAYIGGHQYVVSADEANALIAAGYTITTGVTQV